MTGVELASATGISQSKISKIETAVLTPTRDDIQRLSTALRLPKKVSNELIDHITTLETEFNSWRMLFRSGAKREQERHSELELESSTLRLFQPVIIPGLLQTAAYAKAVIGSVVGNNEQDVNEALGSRMDRQAVLYDDSKSFSFVLTDSALRWPWKSTSVMRAQYDRLINIGSLEHVSIRLIPEGTITGLAPWNAFCVYGDDTVTVETFTAEVIVRDKRDVERYIEVFDKFQQVALPEDKTRKLLNNLT